MCPTCLWRHDPPFCQNDDTAPIRPLGRTATGTILWGISPSLPTRVGGRELGHAPKARARP